MHTEPYVPGRATSAIPKTVEGVEFRCYRTGILRHEWRDASGRLAVGRRAGKTTYYASVDGVQLSPRFQSLGNAMKAAVKRRAEDC